MKPLLECIPNISEGRDRRIIEAAAEAAASAGASVLYIDSNVDANRSVITFAGAPEAVAEGAFRLIGKAAELIDMRRQRGVHPRLGACDVCPLVPLAGLGMDDCVSLSRELASRAATAFSLPVYLYEFSATSELRRNLARIRKGEYEGLPQKMKRKEWLPDFGPSERSAQSGATVIGARNLLVAFNINVSGGGETAASQIASRLRVLRTRREAGFETLPGCKAIAWYLPADGTSQVSTNITDTRSVSLHRVFECCRAFAKEAGAEVTGSEIVGLLPERMLVECGEFYRGGGRSAEESIAAAIQELGLKSLRPFEPDQRILERRLAAFGLGELKL